MSKTQSEHGRGQCQWNPVWASLSRVDVLQVAALGAVLTERVGQLILNSDECPSPAESARVHTLEAVNLIACTWLARFSSPFTSSFCLAELAVFLLFLSLSLSLDKCAQLNQISPDSFKKLINGLFEAFIESTSKDGPGQLIADHFARFQPLLPPGDPAHQRLLLGSLSHLIANISRSIVKPKVVYQSLTEAGLDSTRSEAFVQLWKDYAPVIVEKLKTSSFERSSEQLQDVHWKLKLVSEQSYDSQKKLPLGQLDLTFNSTDSAHRAISMNFSHTELVQFYNNLESIQAQVDQLHK